MDKSKKYNLVDIIKNDLFVFGKIQLILFLMIIISALSSIFVTYQVRKIVFDCEHFLLQKNSLDIEWRNLILEEKVLSRFDRIERIAIGKLHMKYIDSSYKIILSYS